jgi:chromosome segregation ATPase
VVLGEITASVQKAARDIDLVRAAAAEQRMAHSRDICVVEEEIGRVREAMAGIGSSLRRQEGEWKAAIGDLDKKAKQERSEVSDLKKVLTNLEDEHEQLRETVARQGDALAETRRRNLEFGGVGSSCRKRIGSFGNQANV